MVKQEHLGEESFETEGAFVFFVLFHFLDEKSYLAADDTAIQEG